MYLFKYEVGRSYKDLTKSEFTIKKIEVEEKPKTYKTLNFEYVYPQKERSGYEYVNARINKSEVGFIKKVGYSGYTYEMFVLEDTKENRKLFLDEVTDCLNKSVNSIRETLRCVIGYCDSVKSSDFSSLGR